MFDGIVKLPVAGYEQIRPSVKAEAIIIVTVLVVIVASPIVGVVGIKPPRLDDL